MKRGRHESPSTGGAIKRAATLSTIALAGGAAIPLATVTSAHAATQSQWDCIARWESGGRWHLSWGTNDSTGGLQIETRTWKDYGGLAYASQAYQASEVQQIAIGEKILRGQGAHAWTTAYHCPGFGPGGYVVPAPAAPKAKHHAATPVVAVPASSARHTVVSGDCLWLIAKARYGNGADWTKIYAANRSVIGSNPDLIRPGQVLALP